MCTDSLTQAYTFWQQIKQSDEKLMNQPKQKLIIEQYSESIEINDMKYTIDPDQLQHLSNESNELEHVETIANEPMRKKIRKRKTKSNELAAAAYGTDTINTSQQTCEMKISSSNIAFPHFVIANVDKEPNTMDTDVTNDEIYDGVCGGGGDSSDDKMQRKRVKTLKPSAIIPSDLSKINELLSMSPLENDTDTDTKSTIFKCSHCPKAYASPHHLMVHMRKSHLCQYCLETFSKITDLYGHVKEMHRTFECLLCAKEFQSNGNLRQHMRKNHSIFLPAHISLLSVSNVNESDTL